MSKLALAWKALTGSLRYTDTSRAGYTVINGTIVASPDNKQSYISHGYNINDLIYSIVQLISEKVKVAPWLVYKIEDEQALKQYEAVMRKKNLTGEDLTVARELRRKALALYDGDARLSELLRYPNENDTFQDLVANSAVYKLLTGDRYIWAEVLGGGANQGKPASLHLLPSQDVTIVAGKAFPLTVQGYEMFTWGLNRDRLTKESVMHDKYFNPNADVIGSHLYGLAPMKAALRLTDRSNAENLAATAAYQNGGPRYIAFMDGPDGMEPATAQAQITAVKEKLTGKEYAGAVNVNKIAFSGYKMGAVPLGLSPVDLAIIDSEKWSLRRFCNVFGGVPSQLLNDPDNKVYNNSVEGEKALTTRCAMPMLNSFRDQFNRKLGTDWGYAGKRIYVDYDMSVYTELAEDLGKKWAWVKDLPVPNGYKLDMMGLDHPEGQDEFMKEILIPSGYGTADDLLTTDTDAALAEGDGDLS